MKYSYLHLKKRLVGFVGNVGAKNKGFIKKIKKKMKKVDKYVYDIFFNIKPVIVYMFKTQSFIIGYYHNDNLVGGQLPENSKNITFSQMGLTLEKIFPPNIKQLREYENKNRHLVTYHFFEDKHIRFISDDGCTLR